MYFQLIFNLLLEPARKAVEKWFMEHRATPASDDSDLPLFLQRLIQRGEAKGEIKGEARGEIKGKRDTLLHLLTLAGAVPTPDQSRLIEECTDAATLQRWIDNLFRGKTGTDMFG